MTAGLYPVPDDVVPATAIASEMAWADRALCAEVDPALFFPAKGGDGAARETRLHGLRGPGGMP